MQNQVQPPDDGRLRALLRESWPAPPLPPRFQESVWRRIANAETRAIQTPSPFAWLESWVERLLLPRFALASLALVLVAGGLTGVISSVGTVKQQAQERYLAIVAPNTIR
jgi:hypothetical protein